MGEYVTEIDQQLLKDAVDTTDDVGAVLRSHFLLEVALIKVLEHKYPSYAAFKHTRTVQHLRAIRAILVYPTGLQEVKIQVQSALQIFDCVNKTRNEMAHSEKGIKTKLKDADVRNLYSQANGILLSGGKLDDFDVRLGDKNSVKIKTLPNRQQFALLASLAATILDIIPQQDERIRNLSRF